MKEEKIIISNDINIGATISYPNKNKKYPLVLLIAGTGSLDRDGNSLGFKTNIYKELSDMFTQMGCVCIRYDKRGTHDSTGDGKTSGLSDLVNDAANIIRYAKQLDYVNENKVIVCGHSEGSMIATLLTKTEDLKGIILLSGACTSLKESMLYQNYLVIEHAKNMKGLLGWFINKTLSKTNIEKEVSLIYEKAEKSTKPRYFYKGTFLSTKYMKEHNSLTKEDYINLLKSFKGQILAITGKSDVQVDYKNLENISSLNNVTISTPEQVNHLLRDIENEPNIINIKQEYKLTLKKPISSKIKDSIKEWFNKTI